MALTLQHRFLLFLAGCMGTRSALVYAAATAPEPYLKAMAVPAAFVALGFAIIYAGGYRRTGPETGGQPIWWDALRPAHAALYACFAWAAWTGRRALAWQALFVDVVLGLGAFLAFHFFLRR